MAERITAGTVATAAGVIEEGEEATMKTAGAGTGEAAATDAVRYSCWYDMCVCEGGAFFTCAGKADLSCPCSYRSSSVSTHSFFPFPPPAFPEITIGPRDEGGRHWRDRHLGNAKGGAEHLARIHGTEEDKVNCPFYFKIGACRHGERCSRKHNKPPFSQTLLLRHMYKNPSSALFTAPARGERAAPQGAHDKTNQEGLEDFEDFFEEVYEVGAFALFA